MAESKYGKHVITELKLASKLSPERRNRGKAGLTTSGWLAVTFVDARPQRIPSSMATAMTLYSVSRWGSDNVAWTRPCASVTR